jgi:N-acetylmuramoyl-L-alanine amidase
LDPGHGGDDPGAIGPTGLQEKQVVLDIAHRAAPLLARELNVTTLLTRDVDVRVPLEERVVRANDFGADLFLSIHCNAHRRRGARGISSYILATSRDRADHEVALVENASDQEAREDFLGQFTDPLLLEQRRQSRLMAELLQRSAAVSVRGLYSDVFDAGVRSAGFHVLAGALMPAVLFESSFISNAEEEHWLRQAGYRQRLADAIVNAVRAYRAGYGLRAGE